MKPYFDILRNLAESVVNPKSKELAEKETAITSWENDLERNAEKLKVVRGADGRPVEIVMEDQRQAAFLVNGQEKPFDVSNLLGGSLNDPIPSLCLEGKLQQAYEVKIVKRLYFGSDEIPFNLLAGIPAGSPAGLIVKR